METAMLIYLALLNIADFVLMAVDKQSAQLHRRRIPETNLLALAVLGGSIGGILAMVLLRHKIRKPAFAVGLPVIALVQLGLVLALRRLGGA